MASFSSLCLSVSIFRLWGIVISAGSCQPAEITVLGIFGKFLQSLFVSLIEPFLFLCCPLKLCCCIPSSFQCLSSNYLEAYIYKPLLKKPTFDNACSSTPLYFSVSIDKSPLIKSFNVSLKNF